MIEVESPTLTFSGKQFFYITRGLILGVICIYFFASTLPTFSDVSSFQMAGTIVTFEILLLDEVDVTKEDLCTIIDY